MNRTLFLAFIAAFVMLASACSESSAPLSVASLETEATITEPAKAETDPVADSEEAMFAFTQCLRDQGIDVDDPTVDANGNLQLPPIEFTVEAEVSDPDEMPDPSEFEDLIAPCEEYLEGVVFNAPPSDATEFEDAFLAYAECMRDNGVDMPDPDFASGMIDLGDVGSDSFEAADATCKPHLAVLGLSDIQAP